MNLHSFVRSNSISATDLLLSAIFLLILGLTAFFYFPGLQGPFIFDDTSNLQTLGNFGGVDDLPSALYFIFGNGSGPLGRPLSMASFLLNDQTWPSDPYPFKYTNLLLHLVNGCLLVKLFLQIGAVVGGRENTFRWVALISAGIWLMHPFNVSTVLFVVQRMTILSSMVILVGLVTYMHYRRQNETSTSRVFLLITLLALIGGIGLFVKETVILLGIYIGALELTLFKADRQWKFFRLLVALGVFVALSSILLKAVLFSENSWEMRNFNLSERLLTQCRILWDYLLHILIPRTGGTGLMHDDYEISRGIVSPVTTLFSVLGVLCVIAVGVLKRATLPLLSLCIFWFFGGHVLESTVLPLENYFEHRNYLPMALILWSASLVVCKVSISKISKLVFSIGYLALFVIVLSSSVQIWSSEPMLMKMWAIEHPSSNRARQLAAIQAIEEGRTGEALATIENSIEENPKNIHLIMQKIAILCLLNQKIDIAADEIKFKTGPKTNGLYDGLRVIRELEFKGDCKPLDKGDILALNYYLLENVNYREPSIVAYIYREIASIHLSIGRLDDALLALDRAYLADQTNILFPLSSAFLVSNAGRHGEVGKYLEIAKSTKPRHFLQKYQYEKMYKEAKWEIMENQE